MIKVPITSIIKSWLKADARLEELCKEELCEYNCNSAYKGYMFGFEDGAQSQVNEEGVKCIITKRDIVLAFKDLDTGTCSSLVSEEDSVDLLSSSQEYWFFVGAMWLMNQLNK